MAIIKREKIVIPKYKITAFDLKLGLLQYFRFKRQCICVSEFNNMDIVADTGKEIIEVEVKVTASDLIHGEAKKSTKHENYKTGLYDDPRDEHRPNKYYFCVPEELTEKAIEHAKELNDDYGVIEFHSKSFLELCVSGKSHHLQHHDFICLRKSARKLHNSYPDKLHWRIAMRTSSRIAGLLNKEFLEKRKELI